MCDLVLCMHLSNHGIKKNVPEWFCVTILSMHLIVSTSKSRLNKKIYYGFLGTFYIP